MGPKATKRSGSQRSNGHEKAPPGDLATSRCIKQPIQQRLLSPMRPHYFLWLALPLATSCADSGYTSTVLVNTSTNPLPIKCIVRTDNTAPPSWQGLQSHNLPALQESYQADTCFLTKSTRKLVLVKTLGAGDSLDLGSGHDARLWLLTKPSLDWDSVIVGPPIGPSVNLTPTTIKQFVTRTYEEHVTCCGEYERITSVYRVPFPMPK